MGKNNKLFLLMPNHRRNASKFTPAKPTIDDCRESVSNGFVSHPMHINIPKLSRENELLFEGQTILLFILSMATQYLNLYRTVWWLPQSNNNVSVNFHLIDLNVVQFCTLFITRSFVLHLVYFSSTFLPSSFTQFYHYSISFLINLIFFWGLIRCSIDIFFTHGITGLLCISYPMMIYLLMYFPNIIQFYESYVNSSPNQRLINWKSVVHHVLFPNRFNPLEQQHVCSVNVEQIRDEVEKLKTIFNERLKFILFRSLLLAYYSSFVPLSFVQTELFYDVTWTAQHVVITWLSSFLMLTSHLYSPEFYDNLHRSALHLGKWIKLEQRNTLVPCNSWSETILYGQGVVVKHSKEYFKSEGCTNCAEPGNQLHLRYFVVFGNPIGGFGTLIGLLTILVMVQMILLVRATEWYKYISMSIMILANTLTIFRLIRTFYVLKEVYKIEAKLQENSLKNMQ